jgi:hypothetical protein
VQSYKKPENGHLSSLNLEDHVSHPYRIAGEGKTDKTIPVTG